MADTMLDENRNMLVDGKLVPKTLNLHYFEDKFARIFWEDILNVIKFALNRSCLGKTTSKLHAISCMIFVCNKMKQSV